MSGVCKLCNTLSLKMWSSEQQVPTRCVDTFSGCNKDILINLTDIYINICNDWSSKFSAVIWNNQHQHHGIWQQQTTESGVATKSAPGIVTQDHFLSCWTPWSVQASCCLLHSSSTPQVKMGSLNQTNCVEYSTYCVCSIYWSGRVFWR